MNNNFSHIPKVLIVDDNPGNLSVLAKYLEEHKLKIYAAQDGESAIEKAELLQPDIILLDVMLPGINGYETCFLLKKNEKTNKTPIIIMTILDDIDHQLKGFQAGAVDFITKPFQEEVVLARINTHLKLHELTEKLEEKINERTNKLVLVNEKLVAEVQERKKAEDENLLLQEKILQSQKMEAIGQLAGGIAHDFNNILGGIMNSAQLLKYPERNLDEKGLRLTGWILEASKRAGDLTSQLLAFSRKEQKDFKILDLKVLLQDIEQLLNRTISKKITNSVINHAERFQVIGNNSALHSVFLNLAINSSHAIEDTGEIFFIIENVMLNKDDYKNSPFDINSGEFCRVEVKDTGSGIPPHYLQKVFEPFFTTKIDGKGTGLGLSASFGIIQNHHGIIEISSDIDIGTSVMIFLPCSNRTQEINKKIDSKYSTSKVILFVDDDEINRITAQELIESMGHNVLVAENGKNALEIYKSNRVDLVILDMIMPVMNGRETFFELKKIDENCKVILSTGYAKNSEIIEMQKNGLNGIIHKPYIIEDINKLIIQITTSADDKIS
ncbi:MAG: response regulator [Spirochaetaceae bacterium]